MKRNRKNKGFTLIELVVVIIILGILATIAAPRLLTVTDTANKAADEATARTIVSVINIASVNHNGDVEQVTADEVNDGLDGVTVTKGSTGSGWEFAVDNSTKNITVTKDGTTYYPLP